VWIVLNNIITTIFSFFFEALTGQMHLYLPRETKPPNIERCLLAGRQAIRARQQHAAEELDVLILARPRGQELRSGRELDGVQERGGCASRVEGAAAEDRREEALGPVQRPRDVVQAHGAVRRVAPRQQGHLQQGHGDQDQSHVERARPHGLHQVRRVLGEHHPLRVFAVLLDAEGQPVDARSQRFHSHPQSGHGHFRRKDSIFEIS